MGGTSRGRGEHRKLWFGAVRTRLGGQCAPAAFGGQRAPDRKRRALHQAEIGARAGPIWHYVAQDQPLHGVVGGCALSSEGGVHSWVQARSAPGAAVATWVKTGENPAAARRAGGKRGGMQGPCGCARGTPFSVGGLFLQRFHPTPPPHYVAQHLLPSRRSSSVPVPLRRTGSSGECTSSDLRGPLGRFS